VQGELNKHWKNMSRIFGDFYNWLRGGKPQLPGVTKMNNKTKLKLFIIGIIIVFILGAAEYYNQKRLYNMSPGLGIKDLHTRGINGEGINIAIIDQKLLTEHKEYRNRISFYREMEEMDNEPDSLQGPAVASIIAGTNCGVAPRSNLFYWAVSLSGNDPPGIRYADAIRDVIQFNQEQPPEEQVRIVSISTDYSTGQGGDQFLEAIEEAKESGILVFTSSYPYYTDPPLAVYNAALRAGGYRGEINDYIVQPEVVEKRGKTAEEIVQERHLRDKQEGYYSVWVPVEPRLLASGEGEGKYEMFEKGGDSWATPFVAGVAALIIQIDPELTNEQVVKIISQTVTENENGLLMMDPHQAINRAEEL